MKIALVSDWFLPRLGGIELHLRNLATRLAERGHEVTVVTPEPGPAEIAGVAVERLPVPRLPGVRVAFPPPLLRSMGAALERASYDLLHVHVSIGSPTAWTAGWLGDRLGLPTLGTFHSVLGGWRHLYRAADPILRWRSWCARYSTVSEEVAEDLRAILPGRTVEVLPNGIDLDAWSVERRPPRSGTLRLVAVGRLQRRKRPGALLKILADVRARVGSRMDVTLEVAGEGPARGEVERKIQALGLSGSVGLLGAGTEDDVRALLARGDVFVNPAHQESFGLAALEARLAGLPVLARAESGVRGFVHDGVDGFLVDSDDAMVEQLARLAIDADALGALRESAARVDGLERFGWPHVLERHEELYRATMAERAGIRVS